MGLGLYGRSFKLETPGCDKPGVCSFQDPGKIIPEMDNYGNTATPGRCTQSGGTLSLFEINEIIEEQNLVFWNL